MRLNKRAHAENVGWEDLMVEAGSRCDCRAQTADKYDRAKARALYVTDFLHYTMSSMTT